MVQTLTKTDKDFKSNESPEVLSLIDRAKNHEESAQMELYEKYKKLLHGNYIKNLLNFNTSKNKQDAEDAHSILSIIFFKAIDDYDATRSKFITHLTNMIKFRFRESILKERMIPILNNKSAIKINEIIEKTQCELFGDLSAFKIMSETDSKIVSFEFGEQLFKVPVNAFIEKFLFSRTNLIRNLKEKNIYEHYLNSLLNDDRSAIKETSEAFKTSRDKINKIVKRCNCKLVKGMKVKNVTFNRGYHETSGIEI